MIPGVDETHDPTLRSWVASANDRHTDFPIQNLPLGVFRHEGSGERARVGIAIGAMILDVSAAAKRGHLGGPVAAAAAACAAPCLNELMALGRPAWRALRSAVSALLREGSRAERDADDILVAADDADLLLPARVGDYTDFYASIHHATTVGSLFRPDNPLLPNYKWVPIGYHGRASSLVPSGSEVRRPAGQRKPPEAGEPVVEPSRALDYECEVGAFVGTGTVLGEPLGMHAAAEQLFGLCLVNDWSARDIQSWEYQPLGPFLSKSFATTLSPWVVTMEALAPFRGPAVRRDPGDPQPLPYLRHDDDAARGGIDLAVEVWLRTRRMRERGEGPVRLSRSRFADMYWTVAQMVAHHASNGCNLRAGDLLASGTISGPTRDERGCMLELTRRGAEPVTLPDGETRSFLEDGDEVTLRGECVRDGFVRIGFGECRGRILPAVRI
ncbi:MAG TPA: fumarylacetoacetase [Gemmatimonadaceae bacterium]|nr:fumarylacetoacetase [Gemmatimonadaceae bacterium]